MSTHMNVFYSTINTPLLILTDKSSTCLRKKAFLILTSMNRCHVFIETVMKIFEIFIPYEIIACDDKDPP